MTSNRGSRVSLRQRCALVAASPWDSTSSRLPMRSVRADKASRLKLLAPPQLVVLRWPPRPPCRALPGACGGLPHCRAEEPTWVGVIAVSEGT